MCLAVLGGHTSWVLSVSPLIIQPGLSQNAFVSTSSDSTVKFWEWKDGMGSTLECTHTFKGHKDGAPVSALMVNDVLVTVDNEDTVLMWS